MQTVQGQSETISALITTCILTLMTLCHVTNNINYIII